MEIQFGERVDHGGWLIGPKLFSCPSDNDEDKYKDNDKDI